jgi:hypothetical protein
MEIVHQVCPDTDTKNIKRSFLFTCRLNSFAGNKETNSPLGTKNIKVSEESDQHFLIKNTRKT